MVFKTAVSDEDFQNPKIMKKCKLNLKLRNAVLCSLPQILIDDIPCHLSSEMATQHYHLYQLTKEIIDKFMKIRLFTEMTAKRDKFLIRQKLNKSVIFQGL